MQASGTRKPNYPIQKSNLERVLGTRMSEPQSNDVGRSTKPAHQFKWHVVVATVITIVVIEWIFVVTGWMWMRYQERFRNEIPVGMALAMSVLAIAILYCFRSLTEAAIGLAAAAIAAITFCNVFLMDVLSSV